MRFINTVIVALLGLGATAFAAPIEATEASIQDGCNRAYPGDHGRCERGRNEKQDGYREERKGERLIDHGYIGQGLRDERQGQREVRQGQRKECRNGGRC